MRVNVLPSGAGKGAEILELNLEKRQSGDITVIHCRGRMVYREEAAEVSRVVREALRTSREVVLDLDGIQGIDSAGLGELVVAHVSAQQQGKTVKVVGASRAVEEVLELTNLISVLATYPRAAAAKEAAT